MRVIAPAIPVLDHGYVKLIEVWGSDIGIIEAARMSTDKGFLGWEPTFSYRCDKSGKDPKCLYSCKVENEPLTSDTCHCGGKLVLESKAPGDQKLLKYLWTEQPPHTSPFEMAGMIIEVQAPIFVFREWHRHRTQSYNEMSARYTPLPDLNYIPSVERIMMTSKDNRQAQSTGELITEDYAKNFQLILQTGYEQAQMKYEVALRTGVPKELARLILPVGRYSRMRAQAVLLNWFKFLTLRDHHKAQWEIQQYAKEVSKLVSEHFPRTYELYLSTKETKKEATRNAQGETQLQAAIADFWAVEAQHGATQVDLDKVIAAAKS